MGPPHPDQALTQVKGNKNFLYLGAPPLGREVAAVCPGGRVPWTQVEQRVVVGETTASWLIVEKVFASETECGPPKNPCLGLPAVGSHGQLTLVRTVF